MQEGLKSGNVSETCRRHGIAPNLFYRWKDEAEQGAKAALGGRSRSRNGEGSPHPAAGKDAGAEVTGDRNPKKRRGGVSCGAAHSQARELAAQGYTATLVAGTLSISRSSLYYRKKPLVKSEAIQDGAPMRRNSPTAKSLVVADERDLGKERQRLCALIDRFCGGGPQGCTKHAHIFFGQLTSEEWSRLMYKHLDHHLRQFGV